MALVVKMFKQSNEVLDLEAEIQAYIIAETIAQTDMVSLTVSEIKGVAVATLVYEEA